MSLGRFKSKLIRMWEYLKFKRELYRLPIPSGDDVVEPAQPDPLPFPVPLVF